MLVGHSTLRVLLICAAVSIGVSFARGSAAQSPVDPSECRASPRTLPLPIGGGGEGAAEDRPPAVTAESGEPADEETARAVAETIREAIACANAGDALRAFALMTDRYLADLFGGEVRSEYEEFEEAVAVASPVAVEDRVALLEVGDVRLLPDGRATVLVVTASGGFRFEDRLFFAEIEGRWLIDEAVPLGVSDLSSAGEERS